MKIADFLAGRSVDFNVIPHRATHDAQRLAATIHVSGREVAKTVLLRANGGFKYFVAVLPASKSIDFARLSKMLGGSHVTLATEVEIAEHCPDCEFGALPPFGSEYDMTTIVDESLVEDDEIVFEGNTHDEAIRMKFDDFRHIEEPLIGRFVKE